jgi:methylated-DNA-[protein]-cysteine S-methyltransferase
MTDLEALLRTGPALDAPAAAGPAVAAAADVAYARVDSPLGPLVAAATGHGLARLAYEDFNGGLDAVLDRLATGLSPRIVEAPARLDGVRRELDEFFAGARTAFTVPVDLALVTGPFARRLLEACAAIPFGTVATYRDVAEQAGNVRAVRAAGNALSANPVPIVVPCHRVLRTGGGLGGYTGGLDKKEHLLRLEGALLG